MTHVDHRVLRSFATGGADVQGPSHLLFFIDYIRPKYSMLSFLHLEGRAPEAYRPFMNEHVAQQRVRLLALGATYFSRGSGRGKTPTITKFIRFLVRMNRPAPAFCSWADPRAQHKGAQPLAQHRSLLLSWACILVLCSCLMFACLAGIEGRAPGTVQTRAEKSLHTHFTGY